jgi:hypothetical protein
MGERIGGRQKGTPNKATAERAAEIAATGETPLEYMIRVMRDERAPDERRDKMAAAAAPYVHPKLSTVEVGGKGGEPIKFSITDDERVKALAVLIAKSGAAVVAPTGTDKGSE